MTNIREALAEVSSKHNILEIANFACQSDEHFAELIDCYLNGCTRISQSAAWCMSWAAQQKPAFIHPYIGELVNQLSKKDVHPAIIRNAVRVLQQITIPEEYHAQVMNACFSFIENIQTPAAIKAFSLTILYQLSLQYPEIQHELLLIINDHWNEETPAFRSRGAKIKKAIEKN